MEDSQIILNVVIIIILILTLMMAWASHRKLKTHQYYLQALIQHEVLEDVAREEAAAAATTTPPATTPSASSLTGSSSLRRSQGETCNDLRSPMGGKVYNRDCMTSQSVWPDSDMPQPPAAPSAGSLNQSGEMCNDLRSPLGKTYNRDCLNKAVTGGSALSKVGSAIPNVNTIIQTNYPKSG